MHSSPSLLLGRRLLAATTILWLLSIFPVRSDLLHRYRFNEQPGETTVHDSVGTAHGTLRGDLTTARFTGNGKLELSGTSEFGAYVDLPNLLLAELVDATFEGWFTYTGSAYWQRIFDFGNNTDNVDSPTGVTGVVRNGARYLFFTPNSSYNTTRFSQGIASNAGEGLFAADGKPFPPGEEVHFAITLDLHNRVMKLFLNGKRVATGTAAQILPLVGDVNNWLGRSLFTFDSTMSGIYNDFRIYNHVLSEVDVMEHYFAGPDQEFLGSNPGTVSSVTLKVNSHLGVLRHTPCQVIGNFANVSNVDVTRHANTTYVSLNPDIATVGTNGIVTGVAEGVATIVARHSGKEDQKIVKVKPLPPPLVHRYSFNDAPGSLVVADSIGEAHGSILGNQSAASFSGGQLNLPSSDANGPYINLPPWLASTMTNATFEMWVTWTGGGAWQRLFDFGSNTGGSPDNNPPGTGGITYIFASPYSGSSFNFQLALNGQESTATLTGNTLPAGQQIHIAIAYNYLTRLARLYMNGAFVMEAPITMPLFDLNDYNCWLGRSNFTGDPTFNGKYNEFRIYNDALTPSEILASYQAGPDDDGKLVSISLGADREMPVGKTESLVVLANYEKHLRMDVTQSPDTTLISDNPDVVQVQADGTLEALAEGAATVRAAYKGAQDSMTVTVKPVSRPLLIRHRYSFNQSAGDLRVLDGIGGQDGQIKGPAESSTITGTGSVQFNGAGGYVDLPNGIISSLTEATLEFWLTWEGGTGESALNQRVFEFGNSDQPEDQNGNPQTYLYLTPKTDNENLRFAAASLAAGENAVIEAPALSTGKEIHLVITYSTNTGISRLYLDGTPAGEGAAVSPLSDIRDVNNWIGRSAGAFPFFKGRINEFRIYEGVMSEQEVRNSRESGPNALFLAITGSRRISSTQLQLTVTSTLQHHRLDLLRTLSLAPQNWIAVPDAQFTPVDQSIRVDVTNPPAAAAQFYRIAAREITGQFESFESGPAGWTHSGTPDLWELGTPAKGPRKAATGAQCWCTGLAQDYPGPVQAQLRSPAITLDSGRSGRISFQEYRALEDGYDSVKVSIRSASDPAAPPLAILMESSASVPSWRETTLAIPPSLLGKPVLFEFEFHSDSTLGSVGWLIDDFSVQVF